MSDNEESAKNTLKTLQEKKTVKEQGNATINEFINMSDSEENAKITITVKTLQEKKTVKIQGNATISEFKKVVAEHFNSQPSKMRLIFSGKIMKDQDTLETCKIKDGLTVHLSINEPSSTATTTSFTNPESAQTSRPHEYNHILDFNSLPNYVFGRINRRTPSESGGEQNPQQGQENRDNLSNPRSDFTGINQFDLLNGRTSGHLLASDILFYGDIMNRSMLSAVPNDISSTNSYADRLAELMRTLDVDDVQNRNCEGPNSLYVKLISSDGNEFIIKREHALLSGTIRSMLESTENTRNELHFENITSELMQLICVYFKYNAYYSNSDVARPEFPIPPHLSIPLLWAADFLDC